MDCVISAPLTVIVAVRCEAEVLAVFATVIVALFDPDDGETVSHVSELCTVQLILDEMVNVLFPAADVKLNEPVDKDKDGTKASCVTSTVRVTSPPLTVIVAVRGDVNVLAAAVTVIVPLFLPEVGETVSHVSALCTSQLMSDSMLNDFCPEEDEKLNEVADTLKGNLA